MVKQLRRKPAKKTHPKPKGDKKPPKLDQELELIARVLDEYRLDNNVEGWFSLPWRNGWCAVALAYQLWSANVDERCCLDALAVDFVRDALDRLDATSEAYNQATQLITDGIGDRLLNAAVRCLQVHISNSSGGGWVFNDILKSAIRDTTPDHLHEELVMNHRCVDAIGSAPMPKNDGFDHRRAAFVFAWRRGLYHAAYSIQPIEVP